MPKISIRVVRQLYILTSIACVLIVFSIPEFWQIKIGSGLAIFSTGNYFKLIIAILFLLILQKKWDPRMNKSEIILWIMVLSFILSSILGYIDYGYDQVVQLGKDFGASFPDFRVQKGILMVVIMVITFNNIKIFNTLLRSYVILAIVTVLLIILGLQDNLRDVLNIRLLTGGEEQQRQDTLGSGVILFRNSFWTLDPNLYGPLLGVSIIINIYFLRANNFIFLKMVIFITIILTLIIMLSTGSRTALVSLISGLIVFYFLEFKKLNRVKILLKVFAISALGIMFVDMESYYERFVESLFMLDFASDNLSNSGGSRIFMMKKALTDYIDTRNWLFGSKGIRSGLWDVYSGNHSELINMLTQYGVIFFSLYIYFHYFMLRTFLVLKRHARSLSILRVVNITISLQVFLLVWQFISPTDFALFFIIGIMLISKRLLMNDIVLIK